MPTFSGRRGSYYTFKYKSRVGGWVGQIRLNNPLCFSSELSFDSESKIKQSVVYYQLYDTALKLVEKK